MGGKIRSSTLNLRSRPEHGNC